MIAKLKNYQYCH